MTDKIIIFYLPLQMVNSEREAQQMMESMSAKLPNSLIVFQSHNGENIDVKIHHLAKSTPKKMAELKRLIYSLRKNSGTPPCNTSN